VRGEPTILHLDMDAFYASVEQAAKPSLRGKPVIVGGLGPRGVVATASYEARRFGVHSAMPTAQARRLCPHAAYLTPRFGVYREISEAVMALLAELSPLVEPLSLDEAFVDLVAGSAARTADEAYRTGRRLRARIRELTGLSGSVGLAGSKMLAKIASEQAKPDGLVLIEPGTERELLAPMPVRALPGVGPATDATLRRAGVGTVGDAVRAGEGELVRLLGRAHGTSVFAMANGVDDRPVVAERDAKSVSVEDTFEVDLRDRDRVRSEVDRLATRCAERLRGAGRSGRTVVLKVRRHDFTTLTRSETLRGPTDDTGVIREAAGRLLGLVDTTTGVRLLGVGVSGLADFTQEDLFAQAGAPLREEHERRPEAGAERPGSGEPAPGGRAPAGGWPPGVDVSHERYGAGWVQGSGAGRVTVRFERPGSPPGRVRTFAVDDPLLRRSAPLPLLGTAAPQVSSGGEATPPEGAASCGPSRRTSRP
jgi:DNA polymerase IV